MLNISILGYGNLGKHLVLQLNDLEGVKINQVYSPNKKPRLPDGVKLLTELSEIFPCDLCIAAVSDDVISKLSEQLPENLILVHTSGTVDMNALSNQTKRGVFYPLQTFSKDQSISFNDIPICLEANHPDVLNILEELGNQLTNKVVRLNSIQRRKLHLGAVLVNNFSNHLYSLADDYLMRCDLPFELLHPLIAETAHKAISVGPHKAQTGPAKRGDQNTVNRHLNEITDVELQEIYKLLSASISRKFNN